MTAADLLAVRGLTCDIDGSSGTAHVLREVSLRISKGATLGIVGESGSGKSMLLRSILGLTPRSATVRGEVLFDGNDLADMRPASRRKFLGRHVGVVFQNPMTSLNPVVRVGRQVGEASRIHLGLSKKETRIRVIDLLGSVGIPDPTRRVDDYPHQFSGGMRQRIMIAMALACEPDLLIADEATTALDVTVQKDILDLLQRIQREREMTMVLVSHDLGVVSGRTDEVAVMYGGRIVEQAPTEVLFADPRHRYTEALLGAIPRLDHPPHTRLQTIPGRPPDLRNTDPGCPFAARCTAAIEKCVESMPSVDPGETPAHTYRCYVPVGAVAVRSVANDLSASNAVGATAASASHQGQS